MAARCLGNEGFNWILKTSAEHAQRKISLINRAQYFKAPARYGLVAV